MAVRKPAVKRTADTAAIERVIGAGSAPPSADGQGQRSGDGVKFQMSVPPEICALIDNARSLSRTSRRAWLLEAAEERLRREGRI